MSTFTPQWVTLCGSGRDQMLDPIPAGHDYRASVFPDQEGPSWHVAIERYYLGRYGWDLLGTVASATSPSEQEAKAWAEAWTPEEA